MKIYHQSTFDKWPLEDKSIQAIITSPPYYSLRKYDIPNVIIGDWKGQYGLEPTFQQYIEHTLLWCKEAWRVLRNDGVFFLNLGDSYSGGGKCLLDIPTRVSIALVDNQGWIKRNNIIWFKPNAMPESCGDRFSKKYEMIYMFVKKPKYYFDLDAVRVEHKGVSLERIKHKWEGHKEPMSAYADYDITRMCHPEGKNPGDVWEITTQSSPEKHYAMWPEKLVERMIKCSTKTGDAVLDPFAGSGTTLRVADKLNREAYGIDLGYGDIQKKRMSLIQKELL